MRQSGDEARGWGRLRTTAAACIALSALQAAAPAARGEVRLSESFYSEALGKEMAYSIYLPADWQTSTEIKYPVVYLLHGVGGGELDWINLGHADATLDRLIAAADVAPVVAVMPAAENSWYLDTAAFGGPGNYATAISKDLRAYVEATYPVASDPAYRAIMGLSMGGFGSLRLGLEQATQFAAIGSYSPTLFWQYGHIARVTRREEAELGEEFGYNVPHGFFRDHSPYAYLSNFLNAQTKPMVFLAAGDDDQLGTPEYIVHLQDVLTATGHHPEWRIYDGGHEWSVWREAFAENMRLIGAELWKADSTVGADQTR